MIQASGELTGLEKASVLLMSLGSEASEAVLSRLSPEERDLIGAQIVRMRSVKSVVRDRVLGEVSAAVQQGKTLGAGPFMWLDSLDAERVAGLLRGERPHTIALVLSHLSPNTAGSVLACLDERKRNAAAISLGQALRASDEVIKTVDEQLRRRAFSPNEKTTSIRDIASRPIKGMLSAISRPHAQSPASDGADLSALEQLTDMPDALVRELLGEVDLDDLCLSLRVASDELRAMVMRNVPGATASLLRQRLDATAQVRIREIEIAQQRVLGAVRRASRGGALAVEVSGE